jgi:hypothetical protein
MGDGETVSKELCNERHTWIDREIVDVKKDVSDVKAAQEDYCRTIKNIWYTLLVIACSLILTMAGVILGRAVDFHLPI